MQIIKRNYSGYPNSGLSGKSSIIQSVVQAGIKLDTLQITEHYLYSPVFDESVEVIADFFDYVWHICPDNWNVKFRGESLTVSGFRLFEFAVYSGSKRKPYATFSIGIQSGLNGEWLQIYLYDYKLERVSKGFSC
jgi:hypothetical protein